MSCLTCGGRRAVREIVEGASLVGGPGGERIQSVLYAQCPECCSPQIDIAGALPRNPVSTPSPEAKKDE